MCDALSRHVCPEFKTILAFCLSHGRREFVTVAPSFPAECRHVLETLREVYRFDAEAKAQREEAERKEAERKAKEEAAEKARLDAEAKAWLKKN